MVWCMVYMFLYMFYVLGIISGILYEYYHNRVKMQLWLHVPYYSTKSAYTNILSKYYCIHVVFQYFASTISLTMVIPVCSILNFLASRWVVILVLFQARAKHEGMQRCATLTRSTDA